MRQAARILALVAALIFGAVAVSTATLPVPAVAQAVGEEIDYEAWERTAKRAEEAVQAGRASTLALEELRTELTDWRTQFAAAQQTNSTAIAAVRRQIDALDPVPEDGAEADGLAAQRSELNDRLAALQAPAKTAELAFNRADGLVRAIDQIIRERQAEELLELGPSPVNPAHWLPALAALTSTAEQIRVEMRTAWANSVIRSEFRQNLPAIIVLSIIGFVLILRGRKWSRVATNAVLTDNPGAGRWLMAFVISLGSMILPAMGYVAMTEAVYATEMVGLRGELILRALLPPVFVFFVTRWIATRIFPAKEARTLPLNLDARQRYLGRWYGASIALVSAGYFFVRGVSDFSGWSDEATVALLFPFLVVDAFLLWRLAGLLKAHCRNSAAGDGGEESYRNGLTRILALILTVLAVVSPALGAIGYFTLAHYLMFPPLASLVLLAALLVLQRLIVEVYILITGNREGASESLIPILIGFVLVMLSLPFFALAWGARVADLTELWTRMMDGVDLGGTRISPAIFLTLVIVFVIGYMLTRLLQGALRSTVLPKTRMDQGAQNAMVSGIGYVGIFLAAIIAITSAGIDLTALGYIAGALSVGIGFGLQNVVSNFVSGIILLVERPISEGDWIEVGGVHGTVRNISVRSTVVQTFDRSDVIVPNTDLISGRVTNYTRGNTVGRVIVPVGVAYGTDTQKVTEILREIAEAHPMVLAEPAPNVVFRSFGDSALNFEIRAILRDVNWVLNVHSEMNHEIARRFAEAGIEIPFVQRDLWLRNPEALHPGGGLAAGQQPMELGQGPAAGAHLTAKDLDGVASDEADAGDDAAAARDGDSAGDGDAR